MNPSKFAQYAAEQSRRAILGTLLKFAKGDWEAGPDRTPVSPDKRFVAVMDTVTVGYVKWADGKPVDSRMGLIAGGFQAPGRRELDDYDSATWEADENGALIDPWQKTAVIVLISATAPDELFTFSTASIGGQSAIGALCETHAATTEGAGQYPVVTLATDSYLHRDKTRGRIKVPVLKPVDCVEAAPFNAIVAGARGGAGFIPTQRSLAGEITAAAEPPTLPAIERRRRAIDIRSGRGAWGSDHDSPPSPPPIETVPDGPGELDAPIPF